MSLTWTEILTGVKEATGDEWTYLITGDDHGVVMTRFRTGIPVVAAVEAALYAITIPGVRESGAVVATDRLMAMAGQFEAGEDVLGQPRWQHRTEH